MNRLSSLPICDAPISNTSIFYPDDISSGNNVICNTRLPQQKLDDSSSSNSSNSSSPSRPPSSSTVVTPIYQCPSPLVQNLSANNSATVKCVGSCCFKCPLLDNFYPVGAFEKYYLITDAISYISIAGMFFLSVSYTLLQSHRTSGNEPLRYLFYICLVLTCRTLFTANGLRSVQCVDDFTMSTQSNNKICGVQGLWVYIAALWCKFAPHKFKLEHSF